jgi:2,4-dienoyl-CoA reductase-like NADH-dependent reductase (Old Yellow Enzyme family)
MRFASPGRFKDASEFRARWRELTGDLDCAEIVRGGAGPLARPIEVFGRKLDNRFAIHPMEGWDGTTDGRPTDATLRRWRRFGESGAQLIWGGEAWAVSPEARANPNQLCTTSESVALESLARLREAVRAGSRSHGDDPERLVIGLQMTHSGRWARPTFAGPAPLAACADRVLDARLAPNQVHVLTDDELAGVIDRYVALARLAQRAGFDFVDVKACHGYLIHELLGARERPGAVGGTLKHRARVLLRIVERIREACPALGIGVRMSVGDVAPHRRDAQTGIGRAESDAPPRGFGPEESDGGAFELAEPLQVIAWILERGVGAISVTLGSPYTCPHVQRPAAYPPSDGYEPPRDPLLEVARHLRATREIKRAFPSCAIVGAGYTYLQEWLAHVAEHELERGHVDLVGLGRMVLSYPTLPRDVLAARALDRRALCRTFSDCTTAPRNGLPSGCYPLDPHYRDGPDSERLAQIKNRTRKEHERGP